MTITFNLHVIAVLVSIIGNVSGLSAADCQKVRVLSLDVTGTLLATKEPVIQSYHKAALWANLPDPPSPEELKSGFKAAYKERCIESPCFGGAEGISGREWWHETVRRVLQKTGREYPQEDYDRYFRRVYQHFGSPGGYRILEDARIMIDDLMSQKKESDRILLGITSNTPTRHMESVLPMLDSFHNNFQFFTCSQDVGVEKPEAAIFEKSYQEARFWIPDLQKDEVLHIGDSYACDYCGAKAYGFQALMLDRSSHPAVIAYQDWVKAPEYPGKTLEEVQENTITSLEEVVPLLARSSDNVIRNEDDESEAIKPRVRVKREDGSRQEQIKPHNTKAPGGKAEEVAVRLTIVEDALEAKADTEVKETKSAEAAEQKDSYVQREASYVAAVEEFGFQVQQKYSTESWFDAKSKVTASAYDKNTKQESAGKSTSDRAASYEQPDRAEATTANWFDNQSKVESGLHEKKTKDDSTGVRKGGVRPTEKDTASQEKTSNAPTGVGAYYFSNLYTNSNTGSSNPLEDFRDIKSPPIYGTKRTKLTSANKSGAETSETEALLPKLDRDIATGQHLSNTYFDDYSHDDFRDIQSPPIYGTKTTKLTSANKSDAEPTSEPETSQQKLDRDIASGQHLSNTYFDDYSHDDFRDIQSPPIF